MRLVAAVYDFCNFQQFLIVHSTINFSRGILTITITKNRVPSFGAMPKCAEQVTSRGFGRQNGLPWRCSATAMGRKW